MGVIMFSFERGRIVNIALSVNMLGEGGGVDGLYMFE